MTITSATHSVQSQAGRTDIGSIADSTVWLLEDVSIATDNQAEIKTTTSFHSIMGQQLLDFFLNQIAELAKQHKGAVIEVYWLPGHQGIPGNKEADKSAKQAATQQHKFMRLLPSILHLHLLHRKSTCKTTYIKQLRGYISSLFHESLRYDKMHMVDPTAPSANYRELTTGLPCCQSSILIQLHAGHAQLNCHLHNIEAAPTPICLACNAKEETIWHFLLSCMAYAKHWQPLINILQWDALNISKLLSDPMCCRKWQLVIATSQ